jgi:hypothetical protein
VAGIELSARSEENGVESWEVARIEPSARSG